jgi:hypothetical protein
LTIQGAAHGEKDDKRRANRRLRQAVKAGVREDDDPLPEAREVDDVYRWAKDGKRWFDPDESPGSMRKWGGMEETMEKLDTRTIWNFKQNKPTLIVRDLAVFGVPEDEAYRTLLIRGVFKWFSVRRKLIALKNEWKDEITWTLSAIMNAKRIKDWKRLAELRGELRILSRCREQVRELCHGPRWQAPDFDRRAREYLARISEEPDREG